MNPTVTKLKATVFITFPVHVEIEKGFYPSHEDQAEIPDSEIIEEAMDIFAKKYPSTAKDLKVNMCDVWQVDLSEDYE